jgi:hypothetical protein
MAKISLAYSYYKRFTIEELTKMMTDLHADPANWNPEGSFWIYKPSVIRKTNAMAQAVTWKLHDKRRCE